MYIPEAFIRSPQAGIMPAFLLLLEPIMCSLPVGWGALASFLPAAQGLPPRSGHSHVWVESKLLNEATGPQENHCYLPSSATTPYLSCPSSLPSRRGTPQKHEGLCDHILGWQAGLEAEVSLASRGRQVAAGGAPWKGTCDPSLAPSWASSFRLCL